LSYAIRRRLGEVEAIFPIVKIRAREKAGSLSGSQQRLIEFARCLMLDPKLILLDEPSVGLDSQVLKQVFHRRASMHAARRTILMIEQNVRAGLGIATHGIVMESGRVRLTGTHEALLNNPEVGQLYLGGTFSGAF
jgi:ABC-type branched-subunit amino acid transport system ATPase component